MEDWHYDSSEQLDQTIVERLKSFPREPDILVYSLRSLCALMIRLWMRVYHRFTVVAFVNLSRVLIAMGRHTEARDHAHEALMIMRELQSYLYLPSVVQHLGAIAAVRSTNNGSPRQGDRARAARLLGFFQACPAKDGASHYERIDDADRQRSHEVVSALQAELGENRFRQLTAEGGAWTEEQAVAEALKV